MKEKIFSNVKVPTMFEKEMDDLKFIQFINIKFLPMLEKEMDES